jgi:hypothetical protein
MYFEKTPQDSRPRLGGEFGDRSYERPDSRKCPFFIRESVAFELPAARFNPAFQLQDVEQVEWPAARARPPLKCALGLCGDRQHQALLSGFQADDRQAPLVMVGELELLDQLADGTHGVLYVGYNRL